MNRLRVLFAALVIGIACTLVPGSALAATGDVWTSQVAAANNNWFGVAYGNGVFVAVAVFVGCTVIRVRRVAVGGRQPRRR